MKRKLIGRLLSGILVLSSLLPLLWNVPVYAEVKKMTGWVLEGNEWHYYADDGMMLKNKTVTIGDQKYKLDKDGKYIESKENKKKLDEKVAKDDEQYKKYIHKYPITNEYSEEYKRKDDRWINQDGNWFFDWKLEQGKKVRGVIKNTWAKINGYWYHFNKDGIMEKNITIKDDCGNDCVLNSYGILTNHDNPEEKVLEKENSIYRKKTIDGDDYYINDKGEKLVGWVIDKVNCKWYYINKNGIVQKNKTIVSDGKSYVLGEDGAWIN